MLQTQNSTCLKITLVTYSIAYELFNYSDLIINDVNTMYFIYQFWKKIIV